MAVLSPPTLQNLLTDVRSLLGQADANNSNWTDQELTTWVNEAVRRYYFEVVQDAEGMFTKTADLDVVAGVETVALPTDCFKVVRLFKQTDNTFVILPYVNDFVSSYTTGTGVPAGNSYFPSYTFRDNNLVFRPVPAASETGTLRLEYVYFPETLVNGGDSMSSQVAPVFKDLIVMYTVYKAKIAESLRGNGIDTYTPALTQLNDLYTTFRDVVRGRSNYAQYIKPFNPEDI